MTAELPTVRTMPSKVRPVVHLVLRSVSKVAAPC